MIQSMDLIMAGFGNVGRTVAKLILQHGWWLKREYSLAITVKQVIDSSGVYHLSLDHPWDQLEELIQLKEEGKDPRLLPFFSPGMGVLEALDSQWGKIFLDCTPTHIQEGEPSFSYLKKAFAEGLHVVTANKGPLALFYPQLRELQGEQALYLSGAVGAALPTVELTRQLLPGSVTRLEGLLTGTTNFILTQVQEEGKTFSLALQEAQKMGIAERDPRLDLEGWDTAAKLVILINTIFKQDCTLSQLQEVQGIQNLSSQEISWAKEEGRTWKLLGEVSLEGDVMEAAVSPRPLKGDHPLCRVPGTYKGIHFHHEHFGAMTLTGGQSGLVPTAFSLIRDLIHLSQELSQKPSLPSG